jgi:hypothetical protein
MCLPLGLQMFVYILTTVNILQYLVCPHIVKANAFLFVKIEPVVING